MLCFLIVADAVYFGLIAHEPFGDGVDLACLSVTEIGTSTRGFVPGGISSVPRLRQILYFIRTCPSFFL